MTDLLIRNIDPDLKRLLEERAKTHKQNLSEEAKSLIRKGLTLPEEGVKLGTWLFNLVPSEFRTDDLTFEYEGPESPPPDFE